MCSSRSIAAYRTIIAASRNLSCTPIPLGGSARSSRYSEKRSETQHRQRLEGKKTVGKLRLVYGTYFLAEGTWSKSRMRTCFFDFLCIPSTLESGLNRFELLKSSNWISMDLYMWNLWKLGDPQPFAAPGTSRDSLACDCKRQRNAKIISNKLLEVKDLQAEAFLLAWISLQDTEKCVSTCSFSCATSITCLLVQKC